MSAHGRSHWIKLYVEMVDDPKVGLLPDAVKWRWVSVLLLAGELNEDGYLPDVNDMAWRLHTNVETLQGEMRTMAGRGLVELRAHTDGSERWFIPAFAKRQEAASSTERSRMMRHRQRQGSNGEETPVQRNVANSSHNTETETETETEGESGAAAPARPASTFQPVPPELQRQKARRGDVDPEPAMITAAPAAIRLLNELTNYWPGRDNEAVIVSQLGDNPDRSTMARAVELWRASGNKPTNWLGIIDWYQNLRSNPQWTPQDRFKNGRGQPTPPKSVSTPAPGSQPVRY